MNQIKNYFEKISRKCKLFFEKAILPELLAKFFSEPTITNARSPGKVCYCNMSEEDDDLIGCDNKNCQIKWFVSFEVSTYYENSKSEMVFPRMSKSKETKE